MTTREQVPISEREDITLKGLNLQELLVKLAAYRLGPGESLYGWVSRGEFKILNLQNPCDVHEAEVRTSMPKGSWGFKCTRSSIGPKLEVFFK